MLANLPLLLEIESFCVLFSGRIGFLMSVSMVINLKACGGAPVFMTIGQWLPYLPKDVCSRYDSCYI